MMKKVSYLWSKTTKIAGKLVFEENGFFGPVIIYLFLELMRCIVPVPSRIKSQACYT